ncbi:MAG TPA: class I SAM-dependent methyltransferase [Candidatus Eisenbergiella pullicola]|mgnify:CR=1 FL=1|nr:class I SAM-dependent methyltransferase [Candidatus Eisenbergiella pullicola]
MKKKMKSKKVGEDIEALLDSNVVVKIGIESEKLISLLQEYMIPEEYQKHIEIILRSKADFQNAYRKYDCLRRYELLLNAVCNEIGELQYPCKCEVCGRIQNMIVLSEKPDINWRESLVCPDCVCNNHLRFWIGKIRREYYEGMKVFLYEYNTMLHQYIKKDISDVTARSFLQEDKGKEFYEDFDRLRQQSNSFSLAIANDIWEKLPDCEKALEEAARIVCKGGKLIFTTVFNANSNISEEGVFGWDILDKLKKMGFSDAYVVADFGIQEGYLGYLPMYFEAVK